MIYALLVMVPIVCSALAGAISARVKQAKLVSRPLTQAELFADQKELSSWLVKTVTTMDTLHPDKDRVKAVINGLKALQDSCGWSGHDFYRNAFNSAMELVETLYNSLDDIPHREFVPYLRLITEKTTSFVLEHRGKTNPKVNYDRFIEMSKIRNSFKRLNSEINAEQVRRWKTPTIKGTPAK